MTPQEELLILREMMVSALSEGYCGEKGCTHCRRMVEIFEEGVRDAVEAEVAEDVLLDDGEDVEEDRYDWFSKHGRDLR